MDKKITIMWNNTHAVKNDEIKITPAGQPGLLNTKGGN